MGEKAEIRLARRKGTPIAAMLTLRHRSSVVYKYGCSDERFHNLGVMPYLFWRLIEESKAAGVEEIDFGRSDLNHEGLIAFKDRFGTTKRLLTYYRYPSAGNLGGTAIRNSQAIQRLFSLLPDTVFSMVGRALYRHVG
jgi:lipid II:glycine glycyltransferase (peptidoglycan interpeptide bridge formation enzyme)